jgi:hypothetical protein
VQKSSASFKGCSFEGVRIGDGVGGLATGVIRVMWDGVVRIESTTFSGSSSPDVYLADGREVYSDNASLAVVYKDNPERNVQPLSDSAGNGFLSGVDYWLRRSEEVLTRAQGCYHSSSACIL